MPERDSELRFAGLQCESCGYDLRGLAERRCPECGTAFDPAVRSRCASCGYDVRGLNTDHCPECGAPLDDAARAAYEAEEQKFLWRARKVTGAILLTSVLAGLFKALWHTWDPGIALFIGLLGPPLAASTCLLMAPYLAIPVLGTIGMCLYFGRRRRSLRLITLAALLMAALWLMLAVLSLGIGAR